MLQIRGLDNLKAFIIRCIVLGQNNPFENPEIIAESIIREWKKRIIRRVK